MSVALVVALIAGAVAVAQRNEATDQRNRARGTKRALAASKAQQATEEDAPQARTHGLPGQVTRYVESTHKLCSSRSRPIGCSRAPTPWVPSRSRSRESGAPPIGAHDAIAEHRLQPDGTRASGGTSDGRLVEIDTSTGATVQEWQAGDGPVFGGLGGSGGLAIRPNSHEVLVRDEHGGVQRPGERRHRECVLRRRCPRRRELHNKGWLPSRQRPGCGSSTAPADRCSERSMARLRRCSRSAATARGWPSRPASGTSRSSMWQRGEPSRRR